MAQTKKMRLLIITQYFWPEVFRINELATQFSSRGHNITVLTGYPNYPDGTIFKDFKENPNKYKNLHSCNIIRVPLVPRSTGNFKLVLNYLSFALSATIIGLWKLRGLKFDAVFVFAPSPITVGIPGVVLSKVKKSPLFTWVLDLWPETLSAVGVTNSNYVLNFVGLLVKWIYRNSYKILLQSRSFFKYASKYVNIEKLVYFPSWVDEVFDKKCITPAPEIEYNKSVFTVMYAGNIGVAQDFPTVLDAIQLLSYKKELRWIIVGDGRDAKWVANQIKLRSLSNTVQMIGRYPLERMPEFFLHADVLFLSLKDKKIFSMTIPGKLQSYMGAGIPVLAMLSGEGANIVESSMCGYTTPPGNSHLLASNVIKLMNLDETKLKKLGENGLLYCKENFNRELLFNGLEVLIQQSVDKK